jgi:hypothetical protein
MTAHYQQTLSLFRETQDKAIEFGHSALIDIAQGITIRQMSIDLCGNASLEDRIGRWVQAAEWDTRIAKENGQLYEEAREWLTPSHFTVLEKIARVNGDYEYAHDLMEQTLIRNVTDKNVTEAKPVEWLRGKLQDPGEPSTPVMYHKFWKMSARVLKEAYSDLERKGLQATKQDRRKIRIIKLVLAEFSAEH